MESSWKLNEPGPSRISYLIGYLENESMMKSMIGISGSSYDFTTVSAEVKTSYLRSLTRHIHYGRSNTKNNDYFYSGLGLSCGAYACTQFKCYQVYGQDKKGLCSKILS